MSIYFEKIETIRKGLIAEIEEVFENNPQTTVDFAERVVIGEEEEKTLSFDGETYFFGEHTVEIKEFCTDDLVFILDQLDEL